MPRKATIRPAPAITLLVITKMSPIGVPTMTSVSMPGPAVDLDRAVLQVLVAVGAVAAEDAGEVRDLLRLVRVLLEHEERLEQEAVVALAAVQVELRAVEVDLEAVVLPLAHREQQVRVAVRQVLGVDHRHAVGEVERAVAGVRDQRDGADDDRVVAGAEADQRDRRSVVGEHRVVAAERVDR